MELTKTSGSATFKSNVNGYDVSASILYDANSKVTCVQNGMVGKENRALAEFNISYHPGEEFSKNYNFHSLNIDEEQVVAGVINDFVSEAISAVSL